MPAPSQERKGLRITDLFFTPHSSAYLSRDGSTKNWTKIVRLRDNDSMQPVLHTEGNASFSATVNQHDRVRACDMAMGAGAGVARLYAARAALSMRT